MRHKKLPSQQRLSDVLEYDPATGILRWKSSFGPVAAGQVAGTPVRQSDGTPAGKLISVDGVRYRVSRVIWVLVKGFIPDGMEIDHRNGDAWDDRWENLRLATHDQNKANRRPLTRSKTGLKGAYPKNGKFTSCLRVNGRRFWLGTFDTAQEAASAYESFSEQMYGEFSYAARSKAEIAAK